MQQYIRPFQVLDGSGQKLDVTAVNQAIVFTRSLGMRTVRVTTSGTQIVFLQFNNPAVVNNSCAMLPNVTETFLIPMMDAAINTINFVASAVGTTVYISVGEGS